MYEVSLDPARIQMDTIYPWLRGAYWSPGVRRDIVERAYAHSVVAGAYEGDRQIGVARAVTDFATFAWLADVFVDPERRGAGVGRAMVKTLLAHPELQTLRRWLLATRDAHGVYAALGFAPPEQPIFMQLLRESTRWADAGA